MHANTTLTCPVCDTPMIRVTSHEQCPQCGFILPCCDGDAVSCDQPGANDSTPPTLQSSLEDRPDSGSE